MSDNTNEKEKMWRNYSYMYLADTLEMLRGTFCVISVDKTLNKLYMKVLDYICSVLPDIDD